MSVSDIEQLTGLVFDPLYHDANRHFDDGSKTQKNDGGSKSQTDAGVFISAAMVNPAGRDSGNEWISILNRTEKAVSLRSWKIVDQKGRELLLSSTLLETDHLEPGVTLTLRLISPIRLVNTGGSLTLFDEASHRVDYVNYVKRQVQEGVAADLLVRS